jgi:hypothetical protein
MPSEPYIRLDNSGNYSNWKVYMKAELISKDLWDYVDGSISRPTGTDNSKAVKSFVSKSRMACAVIIKHLDPSQYPHCESENPIEIWNNLESIHIARGFGTRQAMMRRFINLRWTDDTSMEQWIAEVRHQASQLKQLKADVTDQWIILVLTNGLPSRFDSFVESLDSVPPDVLTLDYVVGRLLNANTIYSTNIKVENNEAAAMSARLKHWKTAHRGQAKDGDMHMCHNCHGFGHYRKDCPTRRGMAQTAIVADNADEDSDELEEFAY